MTHTKLTLVLGAMLIAAGCGGSKSPETSTAPATGPAAAKPVEYFHPDPATASTVHGKVLYKGAKPARQIIDMGSDAACSKLHAGHPVYDDPVMVGKGGGLANAFVYIQSGLEGKTFEPPKEPVILDQSGCMFVPRIIAIRNAEPLEVKNSDPVGHNIHPMPQNNREWNEEQQPNTPPVEHKFARREVMIPVKCNIHNWMRAYIGVMEHPYFAVTGADGTFEWHNVPPGEYVIAVWHEKLGEQTLKMHVARAGRAEVELTYE